MVRIFTLIISLGITSLSASAQKLHLGFKLNASLKSQFTTGSRSYYFAEIGSEGYYMKLGETNFSDLPSLEIFLRYDHYNNLFFQTGLSLLNTTHTITKDPTSEELWDNDSAERLKLTLLASPLQFYTAAGWTFFEKSLIKPFITVGVNPIFFSNFSDNSSYISEFGSYPERNLYKNQLILEDLNSSLKFFNALARVSTGLKIYSFNVEFVFLKNLTSIDGSPQPFFKDYSSLNVSVGYNLLTFSTIKRAH